MLPKRTATSPVFMAAVVSPRTTAALIPTTTALLTKLTFSRLTGAARHTSTQKTTTTTRAAPIITSCIQVKYVVAMLAAYLISLKSAAVNGVVLKIRSIPFTTPSPSQRIDSTIAPNTLRFVKNSTVNGRAMIHVFKRKTSGLSST